MPPLKPWQTMPVPPPTLPSSTSPACAPSSAAFACSALTCCPRMSLRKPSKVSPTTGSDHASSSAEAAAIASRTTPTLHVFVMPIGVVRRPDSRTHSSPVSSPLPLSRWQPAKRGVSGGTTTVTPVRTESPSISVVWPTRTPVTSVTAFFVAGTPSPIAMPRSRARTSSVNSISMAKTETKRELWGMETRKAVDNFPVSGEPIPPSVAHWLGRIKAAAARVNAELGLLEDEKARRIAEAGDRVAAGELDDQFPIDVFQTGSGTSSNMNANEVIASLAGEDVHANDDVNMGQSSNDVFPSAVHLAALDEITNDLLPALDGLAGALERKAQEFDNVLKSGRTHMMDAVPVTLGQEFGGYAAQVRQGSARLEDVLPRLGQIPLGGTAVGTGLNTHPEFAERVRRILASEGLEISAPADPFESQAARDSLVEASGALKVVAVSLTKIANDLRLMWSGPRAGLAEIFLPELQKGSSIMPGKVNPVIPEVVTQVG